MAITTRLAIADGHICIYMIISCLAILPFAQLLFHRGPGCQVLPDAKDSLWLRARARARSYCLWARLGYQSLAYPPVLSSSIILPNNLFSLPSPELRSLKRCLTISCHTKWMRHGILLNHPFPLILRNVIDPFQRTALIGTTAASTLAMHLGMLDKTIMS